MEKLQPEQEVRMRRWVAALWPSFLLAALGAFAVFTLFEDNFEVVCSRAHDPDELLGVYTLTFFGFWAFGALVSVLALYFARPTQSPPPTGVQPRPD